MYLLSLQKVRPFPNSLPSHVRGIGICMQDSRCKGAECTYAHSREEQLSWKRKRSRATDNLSDEVKKPKLSE